MQKKYGSDPVGLFLVVRRCLEEEYKIVQQVVQEEVKVSAAAN